ncbi:hypothetical protein HYU13_00645 [Candidatus Woesearchaeota archaeon]|nr:hypothetical protein [Candidatus Woesearchaeota archaeon]
MVKIVVNNGQFKMTIPKELAESKGWAKGTKLYFIESTDGQLHLRELKG